jgi:hypothetical protein
VLPTEVISRIYCPACSQGITENPDTMLTDNGWIIEYDMDVARFMMQKISVPAVITPAFLFDEGYCTWRGVYPTDLADSIKEREDILKLAKTDRKRYFEEFRSWGVRRMERLIREGWRKAHEGEYAKT